VPGTREARPRSPGRARGTTRRFASSPIPTGASCSCTATASSVRCRTPKTGAGDAVGGLAEPRGVRGPSFRALLGLYRIATNRCLNALRARSRRPRELQAMDDSPTPARRRSRSGSSPTPTSCSRTSRTAPRGRRRATRPGSRSSLRSSSPSRACRPASARHSCCVTCSASAPPRSPTCSTPVRPRSRAPSSAPSGPRSAPAGRDRDRAPRPNSARERQLVGRFADAVQSGDIDDLLALLTDDALLTMPPQPLEYQRHEPIAAFRRHRAELRGAPLRVVPTRANTQPAFGCYLPDAQAAIARPYGLIVLMRTR